MPVTSQHLYNPHCTAVFRAQLFETMEDMDNPVKVQMLPIIQKFHHISAWFTAMLGFNKSEIGQFLLRWKKINQEKLSSKVV